MGRWFVAGSPCHRGEPPRPGARRKKTEPRGCSWRKTACAQPPESRRRRRGKAQGAQRVGAPSHRPACGWLWWSDTPSSARRAAGPGTRPPGASLAAVALGTDSKKPSAQAMEAKAAQRGGGRPDDSVARGWHASRLRSSALAARRMASQPPREGPHVELGHGTRQHGHPGPPERGAHGRGSNSPR